MLIENVLQELQTLLVLIMRFKKKKNQRILRTLRRSHVVSTYGVGSVYQFKNKYNSNSDSESLMLAGIEEWFQNVDDIIPEWKIYEPRLQEALGKDFFVLPQIIEKITIILKLLIVIYLTLDFLNGIDVVHVV